MKFPKSIKFNNNKFHSVETIYKALALYKKECAKSKYTYKDGEKVPSQLYFDYKDANHAMNYILSKAHKTHAKKNVDPYSYESAVKNMETERNKMLIRKSELKGEVK